MNHRSRSRTPLNRAPRRGFTKPSEPAVPKVESFAAQKGLAKVGDTFKQACPHTGFNFLYQITKVNGPKDYECVMVGIVDGAI